MSSDPRGPIGTAVEGERAPPAPAWPLAGRALLRLAAPLEDGPRLRRHPLLAALGTGRPITQRIALVYFDTPELDLAGEGLALRVRRAGRQHVQTVEVRGAPGIAGGRLRELDTLVPGPRPDLGSIPDLALRTRLSSLLGDRALAPIFEVHLDRTRRLLQEDGSQLRCDLEMGEIRSAWGTVAVCDLELASRGDDAGHPWRLALELLEDVRLRPMTRSLAERGYERVSGRGPATHKAAPIEVAPGAALEELLAAVAESCASQVVANEPAAFVGSDPEGVHQMRVGARRLRSALAFFAPVLPERQRDPLRDELRWLAAELGQARDLDVFVGELLEPLAALRPEDRALAALRDAAQEARATAHHRVRDALGSSRYPRTVFELGAWLARRSWREQALSESSALLFMPARGFASPLLERRHKRARKLGRRLGEASPEERHRLRIRLKKLRYAAEFARGLWPGKRAERYARRLGRLQDVLGRLNDGVTAERLVGETLARLPGEVPVDVARAAGFAAGFSAHAAQVEIAALPRRWKRFEEAGSFWDE
jgi:inorganic triphosphatase YgiF